MRSTLGRFALIERLGQGGMGVVYAAYDPQLDRRVALKLLRPGRGQSGSVGRQRLLREAQALARLAHPNVVPIHDVGIIDEQVFLVMEYVPGQDLHTWLAGESRSWREIVEVYRHAGRGLAAAHDAGIVHRDFKPANARIGADGRVRVLDFGLARSHDDEYEVRADEPADTTTDSMTDSMADSTTDLQPATGDGDARTVSESQPISGLDDTLVQANKKNEKPTSRDAESSTGLTDALTETGALLGTPAYMAPEQFTGGTVGPASDQFSFCVALYEALYGQRPFAGSSLAEIQEQTSAGAIRPPDRARGVPSWLFAVLRRGLAARADERYPSMSELLVEFDSNVARDMRTTRRPAMWFLGIVFVVGMIAPFVFIPGDWAGVHGRPVTLAMNLYLVVILAAVGIGIALARQRLLAIAITRLLVGMGVGAIALISAQRWLAWYHETPLYTEIVAELFTLTGMLVVAALTVLKRLWWCAVWSLAFALATGLWPAQTMYFAYFGYSGVVALAMAMWLVSSRTRA